MIVKADTNNNSWREWTSHFAGSTFQENPYGFHRVVIPVGQWPVTFEVFTTIVPMGQHVTVAVRHTLVHTPFVPEGKFRFKLMRKGGNSILDDLKEATGISLMRHVQFRNSYLNTQYILTSNEPKLAAELIENPKVRSRIPSHGDFVFRTGRKDVFNRHFPKGPGFLLFYKTRIIKTHDEARSICLLMGETMRALSAPSGPARFVPGAGG